MKSSYILLMPLLSFLFFHSACNQTNNEILPVARFTTPKIELGEVTFRNYSENATDFLWDFDDGTTSTEFEPVHEYTELGVYQVTLTASDGTHSDSYNLVVAIGQIYPPNLFELDPLPFGGGAEMIYFSRDGKGYAGGGFQGQNFGFSQKFHQFNPPDQSWTEMDELPSYFVSGVTFQIDNFHYIGLGNNSGSSNFFNFYKYDPQNPGFMYDSHFPFDETEEGRVIDATAFSYNGKGYLIGQGQFQQNFGNEKNIYEYNPVGQSWSAIGEYPCDGNAGMYHFIIGEKLYIGMGNANYAVAFFSVNDFWEYDLPSRTWTQKNDFPGGARRDGISFVHEGYGYIGFGNSADPNNGSPILFSDIWKYDHLNDEWEKIANLPIPNKYELFAFVFGNALYFGGGFAANGQPTDRFFEYQF